MYAQSFLVTSVRGIGVGPTPGASCELGVMAFMNAAFGVRLAPDRLAVFFLAPDFADFLAPPFFAEPFFAEDFLALFLAPFFAVFFAAMLISPGNVNRFSHSEKRCTTGRKIQAPIGRAIGNFRFSPMEK